MNYWKSFVLNKGTYFRDDDVLIKTKLTPTMLESIKTSSLFDSFKKTDILFDRYGEKRILAVLSEGIKEYPEWVEYIKNRMDKYTIELHGLTHFNYREVDSETGYKMLKEAKEEIEDTFKVKVSRWYTPFARAGFPIWGQEVCDKLGIKYNTFGTTGTNCIYFHYWHWRDYLKVEDMLELKHGIKCKNTT